MLSSSKCASVSDQSVQQEECNSCELNPSVLLLLLNTLACAVTLTLSIRISKSNDLRHPYMHKVTTLAMQISVRLLSKGILLYWRGDFLKKKWHSDVFGCFGYFFLLPFRICQSDICEVLLLGVFLWLGVLWRWKRTCFEIVCTGSQKG